MNSLESVKNIGRINFDSRMIKLKHKTAYTRNKTYSNRSIINIYGSAKSISDKILWQTSGLVSKGNGIELSLIKYLKIVKQLYTKYITDPSSYN